MTDEQFKDAKEQAKQHYLRSKMLGGATTCSPDSGVHILELGSKRKNIEAAFIMGYAAAIKSLQN